MLPDTEMRVAARLNFPRIWSARHHFGGGGGRRLDLLPRQIQRKGARLAPRCGNAARLKAASTKTEAKHTHKGERMLFVLAQADCVALYVPAGLVAEPGEDRADAGLRLRLVVVDVQPAIF
jgi:hypothetical protein